MSIVQRLEDYGVEVAFAEANAWHASPTHKTPKDKEKNVTTATSQKKKRARNRAMLYGIVSVALYTAVFTNSDLVMKYFAKGGVFAILPVAAVFVFSYVHGTFASNFWTAVGVEGNSKKLVRKEAPAEKRPSSRPRVNA
ncbi:hypothetical protein [Oceanidesulfovibrio marinus]|uniref:Uncharacterized protein n=1 Tax=Oceanidesulfovibrio marinus TaxID=370038 RepID=A0A6P1ZGV5_9BACT|nr:hypothetical protein [Oceanidesulfovibrio marinus]QJT10321.1 hypothetical protein E8L03_15890 [Oceanidesulfovibrio marinus]TVM32271.1 hypothetical protein DQK91_15420 [Oceanidesulfovibrio marinus]